MAHELQTTHKPMQAVMENLNKLQELELASKRKLPKKDSAIAHLREAIPAPILAHYDRLGERGKKGVAIVHNQVCSGCHMRLPIGVLATLMHGTDIQLCGSCGRYLYLPKVEPSIAAAPAEIKPKRRKKDRPETADVQ